MDDLDSSGAKRITFRCDDMMFRRLGDLAGLANKSKSLYAKWVLEQHIDGAMDSMGELLHGKIRNLEMSFDAYARSSTRALQKISNALPSIMEMAQKGQGREDGGRHDRPRAGSDAFSAEEAEEFSKRLKEKGISPATAQICLQTMKDIMESRK